MASGDVFESIEMESTNPPNGNTQIEPKTTNSNAPTAATTTPLPSPPSTSPPSTSPSRLTTPHEVTSATTVKTPIAIISLEKKPSSTAEQLKEVKSYAGTHNSILAALPSTSYQHQIFREAAATHGGDDSTSLLQQELAANATSQLPQRLRSASSTIDAIISRNPSTTGKHEKKIGHRRVDEGGEVTYKKIQSKQIMGSIQLGIQHTVGILASKPKRDLLMNDFWEMETIAFPPDGSSLTPAHHYSDFKFKVFAPIAFRYFRDLFGIAPDDFLMSLCASPLRQLSNPGASGSIFYLTEDDEFIIKTVQKKECEFLQKLLPGYYMNLSQNPRTLLPKFFGLYCFQYTSKNVRLVAMNNLLPSDIKMHAKYDLKGSTFRRKASKTERQKASPTFKDLDFMEHYPNGIFLETDKYNALIKTIQRDCMVLESFQIMDYSLLMGIHNLDLAQKEKREERIRNARAKLQRTDEGDETSDLDHVTQISVYNPSALMISGNPLAPSSSNISVGSGGIQQPISSNLSRTRSINRPRLVAHSTAMESITADMDAPIEEDEDVPAGGIPARSENDERLILYIGIIDILQSYRLEKKLEHTFKSIFYNGDTVSVCRPSFYAQRFQNFMGKTVFKKTPTFPFKHSPSKRKTSNVALRTPQRTPSQSLASHTRPILMSGSSTPPPAFDDISEEDVTATSSNGYNRVTPMHTARSIFGPQRSYINSNRSVRSSFTDDYSDDDVSGTRSPPQYTRSPHLSRTNLQLATIGYEEDNDIQKLPYVNSNVIVPRGGNQDDVDNNKAVDNKNIVATTVVKAVRSQTFTTTLVLSDVS